MRLPLSCLAFSSLLAVSPAAGVPAPIRLDGPEVARLAWDTRSMVAADFDRDGKLDVAVINNENAKLVLLYQRVPGSPALSADRHGEIHRCGDHTALSAACCSAALVAVSQRRM